MNYRGLARRELLEKIYDRMTDEEKRLFIQLSIQDRDYTEIMQAIEELKQKADSNHHSWLSDFGANVAGNAVFDGAVWLGSKLLKKL